MNRPSSQFEYMSLDDFEELLADKPADEKWELIGGRLVRMMVGARWEHNRICQNIATAMMSDFRRSGSDCQPFAETFWLKERLLDLACFPDVIVKRGPLPPDATSLDDPAVPVEVVSKGSAQRAAGRNGRSINACRRSGTMSSSSATGWRSISSTGWRAAFSSDRE